MSTPSDLKTSPSHIPPPGGPTPDGSFKQFSQFWKLDLTSGFLVSLIALPLCLGISMASNFPPMAGLWTAIAGGLIATFLSNSQLTIKGPAAGLIVVVLDTVRELGGDDVNLGYRRAIAIGFAAAVIQLLFGVFKMGRFGEFFPGSAVHGMLAAIGIIIAGKQIHALVGVVPTAKSPIGLLAEIPSSVMNMNPEVATVGIIGLALLIFLPKIPFEIFKKIPAPLVVIVVALILSQYFDLEHGHHYHLFEHDYEVGPRFLVPLKGNPLNAFAFPDFSILTHPGAWLHVAVWALVGSLESLLSAKAIDHNDPYHRKTNLNRDLMAVGAANMVSSLVGGLPMISEIVRSSANINNGAKSRFANFFHAIFLLIFVFALPSLISRIPLSALAALLVFTGCRLASPKEFLAAYKIGRDQFAIFTITAIAILFTDLLIGVAIGVVLELILDWRRGTPARALFRANLESHTVGQRAVVVVHDALVFSNWLSLKGHLEKVSRFREVYLDLRDVVVVDHSVMEKLEQLRSDFQNTGRFLTIHGLDGLESQSGHHLGYHKRTGESDPNLSFDN